jgi:hypothetical protein
MVRPMDALRRMFALLLILLLQGPALLVQEL